LVKNPPITPEDIILSDVKDKHGNPTKVGKGFVIEFEQKCDTHTWTERWFVARSDSHASMKNKSRTKRLKKAETALNKLTQKSEEEVGRFSQRASKVLKKHSVENMIDISVDEIINQQKCFLKRGRPTEDTPFKIIETRQLKLNFTFNQEQIEKEELLAGWRIYATNTAAERMTLEQSCQYYRDSLIVERSFHRFKGGSLPILPLFLRLEERIKGLMMLLTIALQVLTLIEFVVQRELAAECETVSGLVPGNPTISTSRPTAERIFNKFKQLHLVITNTKNYIKVFLQEKLTPLQQRLLSLMEVPVEIYESLILRQRICT